MKSAQDNDVFRHPQEALSHSAFAATVKRSRISSRSTAAYYLDRLLDARIVILVAIVSSSELRKMSENQPPPPPNGYTPEQWAEVLAPYTLRPGSTPDNRLIQRNSDPFVQELTRVVFQHYTMLQLLPKPPGMTVVPRRQLDQLKISYPRTDWVWVQETFQEMDNEGKGPREDL